MSQKYYEGKLIGNSKGFGFVAVEGFDEDFFIPPTKMMGALDGDKVVIAPIADSKEGNIAEVKKILEYGNQTIVGNLMYGLLGNYVVGDNPKLHKTVLIDPKDLNRATVGDKVVVKVTAQPGGDENLRGEITEVLGRASERSVLEKAIIRSHELPEVFSEEVLAAADKIPQEVPEEAKEGRLDLTNEVIFTIDGDDTRDIDDAISIEMLDNGNYKLGVHIADVGNYVPRGGVIDKEAFERGTSAYFPGYVIPMLPTSLSNGICSLNEGVDRLALSCIMEITPEGDVVDHQITESVIKSNARLTYNKVYATLQGEETDEKYLNLKEKFVLMQDLCNILWNKRDSEGYLELDLPETYFDLNEKGELISVEKYKRNITHEIIEQFMVTANQTVAKHFNEAKVPFVYRVHETPSPDKVKILFDFMEGLGVDTREISREISPKSYQSILKKVDGESYEQVLNKVLLMSLQKARYCEDCLGHFGLALKDYCHFTSPIRRYADLTIHRIIKDHLHKNIDNIAKKDLEIFVQDASEQASTTEKRAEVAERQVEALKMAEYMQKHIGEEFTGTICGITSFGVFVELENTIEGLIRVENLPQDQYEYFEKTMSLKGYHHQFNIGDEIKIKVVAVDLPKRQVDFCEANTVYTPRKQRDELAPRNPSFNKPKSKYKGESRDGKGRSYDKKGQSDKKGRGGDKKKSKKKFSKKKNLKEARRKHEENRRNRKKNFSSRDCFKHFRNMGM